MTAPIPNARPVQDSDVLGHLHAKLRHEYAAVVRAEYDLRAQLRQMVAYRQRLESTADGAGVDLAMAPPAEPGEDLVVPIVFKAEG